MGLCSSAAEITPEVERSRSIDKESLDHFEGASEQLHFLVAGGPSVGKATILKALTLLYGSGDSNGNSTEPGFTKRELLSYKRNIRSSTIANMKILAEQAPNYSEGVLDHEAEKSFEYISEDQHFDHQVASLVQRLWCDPGIQGAFANALDFSLPASAPFFFNYAALQAISKQHYEPPVEHILRVQTPKYGVMTTQICVDDVDYSFHDTSAQRNKRGKWLHLFDRVSAVIFVVAVDQYDEPCATSKTIDGVSASLELFDEICSCSHLERTPILLVLNKVDVFEEKIVKIPPHTTRMRGHTSPWSSYADAVGAIEDHSSASKHTTAALSYFEQRFRTVYSEKRPKGLELNVCSTTALELATVRAMLRQCQAMMLNQLA